MTEIEARSAFGSISRPSSPISSILNFREPIRPKDLWYQCLINVVRQFMILEVASFIILILLLINSYEIKFEHQKNFELISLQIKNLEKRLNRHVFSTITTEEKTETETQTNPPTKPMKSEKQIEFKRERFLKTALTLEPSTRSIRNFNAANYLTGARVDSVESSRCVDSWFYGCDNETYTILEREPVPNKAWCTDDKNAHLTITLSKYIQPIAVSYQHVKWSGTVPDGAPKVYDVVACIDRNCDNTVPLVTDCEYKSSGEQEQFCTIPDNRNSFPINKTQFRFRGNHGNVNVTCAYLIRVFGKQEEEVRKLPEDHVQTCESLKWHHDNYPFIYKHFNSTDFIDEIIPITRMKTETEDAEVVSCSETSSGLPFQWKTSTHTKKRIWYKWLKHHIRQCMILEGIFFILLILLLINSFRIITQNERNSEKITQLQNKIHGIEARIGLDIKQVFSAEEDQDSSVRNSTIPVISTTSTSPLATVMTTKEPMITTNPPTAPTHKPQEVSSSIVNSSIFKPDQSDYVIFERELVPNKAWCSKEKDPFLTIKLSEETRPIAVSYQHLKWNGTIPNGAPKLYDVAACYDENCRKPIPLVSNCSYGSSGDQEQICNISLNPKMFAIDRIQFQFGQNHGNVEETCAYLVKVYSERQLTEERKELPEGLKEKCESIKWHHEHFSFYYNYLMYKNCEVVYENDCCTDCPECCRECETKDINISVILDVLKYSGNFRQVAAQIYMLAADKRQACKIAQQLADLRGNLPILKMATCRYLAE